MHYAGSRPAAAAVTERELARHEFLDGVRALGAELVLRPTSVVRYWLISSSRRKSGSGALPF